MRFASSPCRAISFVATPFGAHRMKSTDAAISAARSDGSDNAEITGWKWYVMPSSGGAWSRQASPMTTTPCEEMLQEE